jgi:hypothetical protein
MRRESRGRAYNLHVLIALEFQQHLITLKVERICSHVLGQESYLQISLAYGTQKRSININLSFS